MAGISSLSRDGGGGAGPLPARWRGRGPNLGGATAGTGRGLGWRRGCRVAVRWQWHRLDIVEDLAGRSGRVHVEVDFDHGLARVIASLRSDGSGAADGEA